MSLPHLPMKIEVSSLQFLSELSQNNERGWFQANRNRYEATLDNMNQFMKVVEAGLNETDHIEVAHLYRIYRDVRFSKDKLPYKDNFGMGFRRATKRLRGGYFLQIGPSVSFAGGGFWAPNPPDLKRIRDEFAIDPVPVREIVAAPTFEKYFGTLQGEELKTVPRGYDKDSPARDLIRKKNFIVRRHFSDEDVLAEDFIQEVKKTFEAMRPYFDYMSMVLTTDLNGESIIDG